MAELRFTILGCGSSGGVPRLGGNWGDCDPEEPRNRRLRCSMLVQRFDEGGETAVLIDTSPDLRQQLLDAGIGRLRRGDLHPFPCRPRSTGWTICA